MDDDFDVAWNGSVREFVEPARAVIEPPVPEPPALAGTPSRYEKNRAWRQRQVEAGNCARCGRPRQQYAFECDACKAKNRDRRAADQRRRKGHQPWRPGSIGNTPLWVLRIRPLAEIMREHIGASGEDPELVRAGTIMAVGFLFRQNIDIVSAWLNYTVDECRSVAANLRANGIWLDDGKIACRWLEATERKRLTKKQAAEYDMAFWLDAMVGAGILTREGDAHLYGLTEWKQKHDGPAGA